MDRLLQLILSLDGKIFFFFQRLQRPWMDYLLAWPTHLGDTAVALVLTLILLIAAGRKFLWSQLFAAAAALLITERLSDILKAFWGRPRPFNFWSGVNVIFYQPKNFAMPSGHAAIAFAAAGVLNYYYPQKMKWTYGAAVWICLTRLYVGVHYPTDLFAGALMGSAAAYICCEIGERFQRRFGKFNAERSRA